MNKHFRSITKALSLFLLGLVGSVSARPYIVGVDVSWVLEDEYLGATYWDGGVQKDLFRILKDYEINFIRLRTFVDPCAPGGYAHNSYSGAGAAECWCDLEHTITHARRIKAAEMGFLLDFHMSDLWASIGEQHVPRAWAGTSDEQMRRLAYDYVKLNVQTLVDEGLRPDMVQVGNEINTRMSGVSISNPDRFAALVNAGVQAVRDIDPTIKIVMQHGRPRPDGDFMNWYNTIKNRIDFDYIGGSTYGTTNNGDDWRQMFGDVVRDGIPVMSLEYTANRTALINSIMNAFPNQMGLGTFVWEPTRYSDRPMFDRSGQRYTTNSRLAELRDFARSINATLPDWVQLGASTQKHAITTTATPGGTIGQNPAGASLNRGTRIEFTAVPLVGWEFVRWSGQHTGTNRTYTLAALESDIALNAEFRFVATDSTRYEGENTKLNNAVIESTHSGFSGAGYANFDNEVGSSIEFSVCVSEAGEKTLSIAYANGATTDRSVSIAVNGTVVVPSLSFGGTGSWEVWDVQTTTIALNAGVNTITMTSLTEFGGPNIDKIDLLKEAPVWAGPTTQPSVPQIAFNPADHNISVVNSYMDIQIQLYSLSGKLMFSTRWRPDVSMQEFALPMASIQRGIYFLKISPDGERSLPPIKVFQLGNR